jgi:sulfite exporter TauE/SafE
LDLFNLCVVFLLGFAFHCPAMCGPVVSVLYPEKVAAWRFHTGRFIGYTLLGAFAGRVGNLVYTVGFAALGIFGFIAVFMVLMRNKIPNVFSGRALAKFAPQPLLLGLLFTFIPCHYLWTMAGIAALSGSAISGAAIMATHAIFSAIGVQAFQKFPPYLWLRSHLKGSEQWILALSVAIMILRVMLQPNFTPSSTHSHLPSFICW